MATLRFPVESTERMKIFSIPPAPAVESLKITIEPADDCDGSLCRQPLFNEEGGLNLIAPHCHLVEWDSGQPRYHAVLCDFPNVTFDYQTQLRSELNQHFNHRRF